VTVSFAMMKMAMRREISHVTLLMTQSVKHLPERTNRIKQASVVFGVRKFPADQSFSGML